MKSAKQFFIGDLFTKEQLSILQQRNAILTNQVEQLKQKLIEVETLGGSKLYFCSTCIYSAYDSSR